MYPQTSTWPSPPARSSPKSPLAPNPDQPWHRCVQMWGPGVLRTPSLFCASVREGTTILDEVGGRDRPVHTMVAVDKASSLELYRHGVPLPLVSERQQPPISQVSTLGNRQAHNRRIAESSCGRPGRPRGVMSFGIRLICFQNSNIQASRSNIQAPGRGSRDRSLLRRHCSKSSLIVVLWHPKQLEGMHITDRTELQRYSRAVISLIIT